MDSFASNLLQIIAEPPQIDSSYAYRCEYRPFHNQNDEMSLALLSID